MESNPWPSSPNEGSEVKLLPNPTVGLQGATENSAHDAITRHCQWAGAELEKGALSSAEFVSKTSKQTSLQDFCQDQDHHLTRLGKDGAQPNVKLQGRTSKQARQILS